MPHLPLTPAMMLDLGDLFFVEAIWAVHASAGRPVTIGLSGSQGSGKSTTAARLAKRITQKGLSVAVCSLDDFYLTRAEREALSRHVHPLLATRGVPGTHDVALIEETIAALVTACKTSITALPSFDKAADERQAPEDWQRHQGSTDVVLLEGWCIGARPQRDDALADPINELEKNEDSDGRWRQYVNSQLAADYARLFNSFDLKLMLRAPSFACVHGWRKEQELGLRRDGSSARPAMDDAALARFIAHYERLTEWLLKDEPADLIADLDATRVPTQWRAGYCLRSG